MDRIVKKALDYSGVTKEGMWRFLISSLSPLVREIRSVINSRFGEVTNTALDYTITEKDEVIIVDTSGGAVVLTLPPVIGWTKHIIVKRFGAANVTVQPDADDVVSGVTIDGGASVTISTDHQALTFVTDSNTWYYVNYV